MATPLGTSFSTDENAMAQTWCPAFWQMVESLVIEFDQEKFEEFFSSASFSPKAMRQYHKVSSETRSQISLEITFEVARITVHNTEGATSRAAHVARVNISQETRRAKAAGHSDGEDQFGHPPPLQILQFQVVRGFSTSSMA